ncbi:MAG: hypothetical protein EB127_02505 [Alphaproteobacteria bacterium]|nr:hypothetical protein [Alphaproteobacteria bacterium]
MSQDITIANLDKIDIQGTLIRVTFKTYAWHELKSNPVDEIKESLVKQLCNFLLEGEGKSFVNFSKTHNSNDYHNTYMATICITPSNQTQVLVKRAKEEKLI